MHILLENGKMRTYCEVVELQQHVYFCFLDWVVISEVLAAYCLPLPVETIFPGIFIWQRIPIVQERSYHDSVGLGSCTGEKGIVIKVNVFVNFEVDCLKKKMKMKKLVV